MNRRSSCTAAVPLLALAAAVACSDSEPSAASCRVALAGDTSETATLPASCAGIEPPSDGGSGYVFTLTAATEHLASLSIRVPLGDSPSSGVYSSDSITGWEAVGAVSGDSTCTYAAGTESVPPGSLLLTLTSVDGSTAHGTLSATLYVHAPLYTDCGPTEFEQVAFAF